MEKYIDPKILPLIKLMNQKGLITLYSCAGFGYACEEGSEGPYGIHIIEANFGSPYVMISRIKSNTTRLNKLLKQCISMKTGYRVFSKTIPTFTIETEQKNRVTLRIPNEVSVDKSGCSLKLSKSTIYSRKVKWIKKLESLVMEIQ